MGKTIFIGEHLWVGNTGHFFIILGFVAALLSAISYFSATSSKDEIIASSWRKMGRIAFYIHAFSLFMVMSIIFYAMYNHMYEYTYVYDHVSDDLPLKYILSAFWEGQEGSFMLWMFWHCVLGLILIKKSGKLESPVLFSFALVEVILMTMLLGIHIPWGEESIKIGSNPTTLLRQVTEAPIFANADYLSLIKGRGLNPLLQNYWMTIHPPTLFLGFASTLVPFAFAFAGLWTKDHASWLKPALPWSLFSAGILGTGILMGSLWAYVALTFGGYWAWDPVENASLVPWITLVGGIHLHLVHKSTGHGLRTLYFLYLVTFVLILYSTFLTRSGVLGDTSAHSFTQMGLEWQLVILILVFLLPGIYLLIRSYKSIPQPEKEETIQSREFWMYIGSLVLLFSAVLITYSTSLPVFNKIGDYFYPGFQGKVITNVVAHYNNYQMWIAIFVSLLSSASLYLRYKAFNWSVIKQKMIYQMGAFTVLSGILTYLTSFWLDFYAWQYVLLSFTGIFAMVANGYFVVQDARRNMKLAWSGMAHLGFGMMIVGIIASGLNQKSISSNPFVFKNVFDEDAIQKYIQLIKDKPLFSQGYLITYVNDTLINRERKYAINFKKLNDSMEVISEFDLYPNAVYSNDMTKIAAFNPDTRHQLHQDIFTAVAAVPPALQSVEEANKIEDSLKFVNFNIGLMDTLQLDNVTLKLEGLSRFPKNKNYLEKNHDVGLEALVRVTAPTLDIDTLLRPAVGIDGSLFYSYPEALQQAAIRIKIEDSQVNRFFTEDKKLKYTDHKISNNQSFEANNFKFTLLGFNKNPENKNYTRKEGDIAIAAKIRVEAGNQQFNVEPLYIIRDNFPMSIKEYIPELGLHVRFSNIEPTTETFSFKVAKEDPIPKDIELSIAQNIPRTDYLILQATIFPGINLFWIGSCLMMLSLFLAAYQRYGKKITIKNEY